MQTVIVLIEFRYNLFSVAYGKNLSRNIHNKTATSRDRPKSAPYPRLKNSKRTSKSLLQYTKIFLKVAQNRKKLEGRSFSFARYCIIRGRRKNFFGSVPWSNRFKIKFCSTFGRTILVTSGVSKKTLRESHDYIRLFSQEKRPLKMRDIWDNFIIFELENKFKNQSIHARMV